MEQISSGHSTNGSEGAFSSWQDEIVKQLSHTPPDGPDFTLSNTIPEVLKAKKAIDELEASMGEANKPVQCPAGHNNGITQEAIKIRTPRKCPVSHVQKPPAYAEMEQDFTTQGKPSSLECPFAAMARAGPLLDEVDPVAAEFHADVLSAQSLDEARACGRCPMRFMDKHSPEEIAEYFEKHKHELPRSHEICVKRYQQNETQIRELDAKYGNMISMIQGLGNKHKQYLASEQQAPSSTQKSGEAVQKWADNVSGDDQVNFEATDGEAEHENRVSHFDKPLRDIRVGESPTRPWGISVPLDTVKATSAASSRRSSVPSMNVDTGAVPDAPPEAPTLNGTRSATPASHTSSRRRKTSQRMGNQIIFNGPVFLGYSPEQAAIFLQQLNTQS